LVKKRLLNNVQALIIIVPLKFIYSNLYLILKAL